jgi:hypothetical protein
MSITSAQSYEMRISRSGDKITNPPQPYWQTVERLLTDRGVDHVARLLAYALRDLDKALCCRRVRPPDGFSLVEASSPGTRLRGWACRTRTQKRRRKLSL